MALTLHLAKVAKRAWDRTVPWILMVSIAGMVALTVYSVTGIHSVSEDTQNLASSNCRSIALRWDQTVRSLPGSVIERVQFVLADPRTAPYQLGSRIPEFLKQLGELYRHPPAPCGPSPALPRPRP